MTAGVSPLRKAEESEEPRRGSMLSRRIIPTASLRVRTLQ
jgi:hypothetical protein